MEQKRITIHVSRCGLPGRVVEANTVRYKDHSADSTEDLIAQYVLRERDGHNSRRALLSRVSTGWTALAGGFIRADCSMSQRVDRVDSAGGRFYKDGLLALGGILLWE